MKRFLSLFTLLLFCAAGLFAGTQYDFNSVTSGRGGTTMSGTASVDGASMRLDLNKGDGVLFKDRSVVLSSDGGKTLIVLNPGDKTFYELQLDQVFSAMGSVMKSMGGMFQMSVDNQKVDVQEAGSGGELEGYPTRKYVINASYDLNMKIMGMKSSSHIESTTESWATDDLSTDLVTFVQMKNLRTGIEGLDDLLSAQTSAVKGFPLKQVTTTTTTQGRKKDTQTTTVTIANVRTASIPSDQFEVPAGYTEGESPLAALEQLKRR